MHKLAVLTGVALGLLTASAVFSDNLPFTFVYDGVAHRGTAGLERLGGGEYRLDANVVIRMVYAHDDAFGADEYTVWFENRGRANSAVLEQVVCLDSTLAGARPVVRGILGDHDNLYRPYEKDLAKEPLSYWVRKGRATHGAFPYFDLVHGEGGTMLALGWSGNWKTDFSAADGGLHVVAETNPGFKSVLLPGEKVRTGQVVMLPYEGRDAERAMNRWRRWYLKRILPKNLDGSDLKPFSSSHWAGDTGLKNLDGSVSERSTTWRRTFDILERERVLTDFRWFDAGWYCEPDKKVDCEDWHWVGTWTLDWVKWPGTTFADMVAYTRKEGMKTLMWFEPERVSYVEDLAKNFGYDVAWSAPVDWQILNDIGNPDCYAWTRDRVMKVLDETDVDLFREDFNVPPGDGWLVFDARKAKATGLARAGITENLAVQAHYRLWDEIIANRRAHGRCPYVDSCASGGGRIDIESMRRGFPLMRSDCDRASVSRRLSQTTALCRWLPFHGSFVKETKDVMDTSAGKGPDKYVFRASLLPICNLYESFSQNRDFDFAMLRDNLAEWRSLAPYTLKDYHLLTPWRSEGDDANWTVIVWDDPDAGTAILLGFRQAKCTEPEYKARFDFMDLKSAYEIVDADTGAKSVVSGVELRYGLKLRLEQPRSSVLLRLRRMKPNKAAE